MRIANLMAQKTTFSNLMQMQTQVNELQQKISSGKQRLRPSEDLVSAQQSVKIESHLSHLKTYQNNISIADTKMTAQSAALTEMLGTLEEINELRIQAGNSTLSDGDRGIIAKQLEVKMANLLNVANTQDESGNYVFSGYQGKVKPFINENGQIVYKGDQGQQLVNISPQLQVAITQSGYDLFEGVKSGNGQFSVQAALANTGTGVIYPGEVSDTSAFVEDTYTVDFTTNGSGDLVYSVTGAVSGQVIPAPPATVPAGAPLYVDGGDIVFNGHRTQISGLPTSGDSFTVEPSKNQSIFSAVQGMLDALNQPINNDGARANLENKLNQFSASLSQGQQSVLQTVTQIGTQQNALDREKDLNSSLSINYQANLVELQDIDYTEAITKFTQQMSALELAQKSFVNMQELSLFKVLWG